MWPKIIATDDDKLSLLLRLVLGVVMFPHAAQKVFGWFGGGGISGTVGFMHEGLGLPVFLAYLVIATEFLASLGLIAGALTRVAAAGISAVMIGAIATVHLPNGFFMNWTGQQAGEGFEYHLLVLAITATLMIKGGGAASVDRMLVKGGEW